MKGHDLASMQQDIKRLCTAFGNPESFEAVRRFLEDNISDDARAYEYGSNSRAHNFDLVAGDDLSNGNRCVYVAKGMSQGMNEKSIIRDDFTKCDTYMKSRVVGNNDSAGAGNRCVNVTQSINNGMNEKSIIKEQRDHYDTIHPTQKPVSLLIRILNLISKKGDTILDCFSGSGSTAVACMKSGREFIGFELDKEYYDKSIERIKGERDLFTF